MNFPIYAFAMTLTDNQQGGGLNSRKQECDFDFSLSSPFFSSVYCLSSCLISSAEKFDFADQLGTTWNRQKAKKENVFSKISDYFFLRCVWDSCTLKYNTHQKFRILQLCTKFNIDSNQDRYFNNEQECSSQVVKFCKLVAMVGGGGLF